MIFVEVESYVRGFDMVIFFVVLFRLESFKLIFCKYIRNYFKKKFLIICILDYVFGVYCD